MSLLKFKVGELGMNESFIEIKEKHCVKQASIPIVGPRMGKSTSLGNNPTLWTASCF